MPLIRIRNELSTAFALGPPVSRRLAARGSIDLRLSHDDMEMKGIVGPRDAGQIVITVLDDPETPDDAEAASVASVTAVAAAVTALQTPTLATLTYAATTTINAASTASYQQLALTGNLTLATTGLTAGRVVRLILVGDGSSRTLTFPAWKFVGSAAPTALASGKVALLTIISRGTTDANVVATYFVEP